MERDRKMTKGSGWFHSDPINTAMKTRICGLHEINPRPRIGSVSLRALRGYLREFL